MRTITLLLFPALLLSACIEADDELETDEAALEGGVLADPWVIARAVKPSMNCTATLIAPSFVILAEHCTHSIEVNDRVFFYTGGPGPNFAVSRRVGDIIVPPGEPCADFRSYCDTLGRVADLALLRLEIPAPTSSVPATLLWRYPGDYEPAIQVGMREEAGDPETGGIVRQVDQMVMDNGPRTGQVTFAWDLGEGTDSGGPYYWYRKIVAIHHGGSWGTSVPVHLPWILAAIGFQWPGSTPQSNTYRYGTVFEQFSGATEKTCQYASVHTPTDAYNYLSGTCTLVKDVTYIGYVPGYRSAAK